MDFDFQHDELALGAILPWRNPGGCQTEAVTWLGQPSVARFMTGGSARFL